MPLTYSSVCVHVCVCVCVCPLSITFGLCNGGTQESSVVLVKEALLGVTSEELSIQLIYARTWWQYISDQKGKAPEACSYTVATPQRQPEHANSNLRSWKLKRDWEEVQPVGFIKLCRRRKFGLRWLRINILNVKGWKHPVYVPYFAQKHSAEWQQTQHHKFN